MDWASEKEIEDYENQEYRLPEAGPHLDGKEITYNGRVWVCKFTDVGWGWAT